MKMVKTYILFHILILVLFLIVQASSSYFNDKTSPVKHLLGSKIGDTVEGLEQVRKYLSKYGYLQPSTNGRHQKSLDTLNDSNVFDQALKKGIKKFQLFYNINVSGILDEKTLSIMMKPRCNFPDLVNGARIKHGVKLARDSFIRSYFGLTGGKWYRTNLSWNVHDSSPQKGISIRPITKAFKTWADASVFTFTQSSSFDSANVKISFVRGALIGNGVLAHSDPPPRGILNFNADELWGVVDETSNNNDANINDIETVALHEIGHILGLAHSMVRAAVMWPNYNSTKRSLHSDDIAGITELYS